MKKVVVRTLLPVMLAIGVSVQLSNIVLVFPGHNYNLASLCFAADPKMQEKAKAADPSLAKKQPSEDTKKVQAKTTAAAVNQIPGIKVAPNEMQAPELPPIKGFHPIKKLLRPVEQIGAMSVTIEQQLMKMEGPIAALQPPMLSLEGRMGHVNATMNSMQTGVNGVTGQMEGVRSDLRAMRKDILDLKQPILTIQKPLVGVSKPLDKLQKRLDIIFWAIIVATFGVVFLTPVAAMYIYRHREKLFRKNGGKKAPEVKPLTAA